MRLKAHDICPPGGYKIFVPETNTNINASSFRTLVAKYLTHLLSNGIKVPPDVNADVEEKLCARLPPGHCVHDDNRHVESAGLSLEQLVMGAKSYGTWLLQGGMVEPEEANRRARICADCSMNQDGPGCTSCGRNILGQVVSQYLLHRTTEYDHLLKNCATCGCPLRISVHAPLEVNIKHMPASIKDKLPAHCWKKV